MSRGPNGDRRKKSVKNKSNGAAQKLHSSGFAACYRGKTIATAREFDSLTNKEEVRRLLGKKGFVIKHTVPEGTIAVY